MAKKKTARYVFGELYPCDQCGRQMRAMNGNELEKHRIRPYDPVRTDPYPGWCVGGQTPSAKDRLNTGPRGAGRPVMPVRATSQVTAPVAASERKVKTSLPTGTLVDCTVCGKSVPILTRDVLDTHQTRRDGVAVDEYGCCPGGRAPSNRWLIAHRPRVAPRKATTSPFGERRVVVEVPAGADLYPYARSQGWLGLPAAAVALRMEIPELAKLVQAGDIEAGRVVQEVDGEERVKKTVLRREDVAAVAAQLGRGGVNALLRTLDAPIIHIPDSVEPGRWAAENGWVRLHEAADVLDVDVDEVADWIQEGRIEVARLQSPDRRRLMLLWSDVCSLLDELDAQDELDEQRATQSQSVAPAVAGVGPLFQPPV